MNIAIKDRFKFIIARDGEYFQAWNIYDQAEERTARWTGSRASARKYETIQEAREDAGSFGGSRILRYDMLTTEVVDVWEEMRRRPERRWVRIATE